MNAVTYGRQSTVAEVVDVQGPDMRFWAPEPLALLPQQWQRAHEIERRADQAGLSIRHDFSAPTFEGQVCFPGPERSWYFMRLQNDPLWKAGFPMPQRVMEDLRQVKAAGIEFDDWYVAHDFVNTLAQPAQEATLEMLTPPPSSKAQQTSQTLADWAMGFFRAATLPALGVAGGLVAAAAIGGMMTVGASAVLLDPILWGIVAPDSRRGLRPNQPAMFFYVTHWHWE